MSFSLLVVQNHGFISILAVNPCGNVQCKVEQGSIEYCAYPEYMTACDCGPAFQETCDSEYNAIYNVIFSQVFICSQGVCLSPVCLLVVCPSGVSASWWGVCLDEPLLSRYGQPAGGTHPPGMHTCSYTSHCPFMVKDDKCGHHNADRKISVKAT